MENCKLSSSRYHNILNERPIGRHPSDPESCLCPNDLLLGRYTSRIPSGPFKEHINQRQRFSFVQKHYCFILKGDSRLLPIPIKKKCHTKRKNVRVGDIVTV